VYKGSVLLLDAYFDRGALFPSLGFTAADITRADAILRRWCMARQRNNSFPTPGRVTD